MTQTSRAAGLFQPHLRDMAAYAAVDPPHVAAKKMGVSPDQVVKIDGNENPYGSSPKVAEALAKHSYHVYPDPAQRDVRQALSEYTRAPVDNLVAGAGADELIDLLARLFLGPGDQAIDLPPTFGMYPIVVQVQAGGAHLRAPRRELRRRRARRAERYRPSHQAALPREPEQPHGHPLV